jgi:hypothetical protein
VLRDFVPDGFLPLEDAIAVALAAWREREPESTAPGDLDAAWKRLQNNLFAGSLFAYALSDFGELTPVPERVWGGTGSTNVRVSGLLAWFNDEGTPECGRALVRSDDLQLHLAGEPSKRRPGTSSITPVPRGRGGAPPKYDWEAFMLEAFRVVYVDGPPKTQAELIKKVSDWYQTEIGDPPDAQTAKPRVRKLWVKLGLDHG